MDDKEIRTKCIEFALRYVEYQRSADPDSGKYTNDNGVVLIARKFEKFIEYGERENNAG
jgi:hypothetical protein